MTVSRIEILNFRRLFVFLLRAATLLATCDPKEAADATATATGAPQVATPTVAGPTARPAVMPGLVTPTGVQP
jgi:hypothetical protein